MISKYGREQKITEKPSKLKYTRSFKHKLSMCTLILTHSDLWYNEKHLIPQAFSIERGLTLYHLVLILL